MNFKRLTVLSSSLFLLAACSNTTPVEPGSESEEISMESVSVSSTEELMSSGESSSTVGLAAMEESSSTESTSRSNEKMTAENIFDGLIEEKDFSNKNGYQAWTDYKQITKKYTLGDYLAPDNDKGSTSAEIIAMMGEDIEQAEVEISDNQKMILFRYPDEEGGEFSETSSFLAEITFYFVDDHLLFSSITPGYFSVELNDAPEIEILANLFTVSELESLNPQVYTVAEVNANGQHLRQVMVPSQPLADQTDVVLNAFYLFIKEDQVLHYAYLPFEEVSQDFPTNSVLLFNSYFNEMGKE